MSKVAKTLVISSIQRGAPRKDTGLPGNMIINNDKWFSGVEYRNQILGAEFPLDIPSTVFLRSTWRYTELTVTEEMLNEGNGVHKETINGREVSFKKVGISNIELRIDWSTINFTDSDVNATRIKALLPSVRTTNRPAGVTRPASTTEKIAEEVQQPENQAIAHENLGNDGGDNGEFTTKELVEEGAGAMGEK